jgi:hypothetical protein
MIVKKRYSKPEIHFDDFSLTTSISAGCEAKITNAVQFQCGLPFAGKDIFTSQFPAACEKQVTDGSPAYNGLCYHVPIDTKNIFNS